MVEALRGLGYTTETALADLIDNSISAGAATIWLLFLRAPLRKAKERRMAKLVCPASGQTVDCLLVLDGSAREQRRDIERCSVFGRGAVTCEKRCLAGPTA